MQFTITLQLFFHLEGLNVEFWLRTGHNVYEALSFVQKTTEFYPYTHMVGQTTVSPDSFITIALKWITQYCYFFSKKKTHLLINLIEPIAVPTRHDGFQPRELCSVPL